MSLKRDLSKAAQFTAKKAAILLCVLSLLVGFGYWKFRETAQAVYVEVKFDVIQDGPYKTLSEVDEELSWLRRSEIGKESIRPSQIIGHKLELIRGREDLIFVGYYWGQFGFIVVFDHEERKLTVLASDI